MIWAWHVHRPWNNKQVDHGFHGIRNWSVDETGSWLTPAGWSTTVIVRYHSCCHLWLVWPWVYHGWGIHWSYQAIFDCPGDVMIPYYKPLPWLATAWLDNPAAGMRDSPNGSQTPLMLLDKLPSSDPAPIRWNLTRDIAEMILPYYHHQSLNRASLNPCGICATGSRSGPELTQIESQHNND